MSNLPISAQTNPLELEKAQKAVDLLHALLIFGRIDFLRKLMGRENLTLGVWDNQPALFDYAPDGASADVFNFEGQIISTRMLL